MQARAGGLMEHLSGGNGHRPGPGPRSGPDTTADGALAGALGSAAPIGEVVDTSVAEFAAQACQFNVAPPFGSFVKVTEAERTIYAVVYAIHSGSLEPGGRPVLRGRDGMRDAAIYQQNPDLEQLLRTEFAALIVGFEERGAPRMYLPPSPPRLHWSVVPCDAAETARLATRLDYFRTILAASQVPADALLAANIRILRAAGPAEPDVRVRAGRELATLLKHDYPRLLAILRALSD